MTIKAIAAQCFYLCFFFTGYTLANCDFDTDDADAPDFMDKIIACEKQQQVIKSRPSKVNNDAIRLYGDGTVNPQSGISERPVVAAGSMNHSAKTLFAARQAFSLRPDAKFEESVTIATQRLYIVMAHYCAQGWTIESQWTEPNPRQEGDYFLHHAFRCAD